jgi:cell division septum initiation protein DivIVA
MERRSMNRAELDQRLDDVVARLPAMREKHEDRADRLMVLAGELDLIEDAAVGLRRRPCC